MMRAMKIVNVTGTPNPSRVDTRATANRFIKNPLVNVVYDNFKYADPMFNETRAVPTATATPLATKADTALNANIYRIFYPTDADKATYAGFDNPWQAAVCKF